MARYSQNYRYMVDAVKRAHGSMYHWLRYLRKVIFDDYTILSDSDVEKLLKSPSFDTSQKVMLELALKPDSPTHTFVTNLNKPYDLSRMRKRLEDWKREYDKKKSNF